MKEKQLANPQIRVIESINRTMSALKELRDQAIIKNRHLSQSNYSYRLVGLQITINKIYGVYG